MMEGKIERMDGVSAGARTVLVVDDMEANRALLTRRLERHGFGVFSVDSGPAALAILAHSLPDIILLDYMMPQMSGIEVLRELRSNSVTYDLPVIMVTARAESEATVEALQAGADDYVTKPIDFAALKARIDTQLSRRTDSSVLKRSNAALNHRVAMRSVSLADMEVQLKNEIERRKELERQLEELQQGSQRSANAEAPSTALVEQIASRFDTIFTSVSEGRSPNLAQMSELRSLIEKARSHSPEIA